MFEKYEQEANFEKKFRKGTNNGFCFSNRQSIQNKARAANSCFQRKGCCEATEATAARQRRLPLVESPFELQSQERIWYGVGARSKLSVVHLLCESLWIAVKEDTSSLSDIYCYLSRSVLLIYSFRQSQKIKVFSCCFNLIIFRK